MQADGSGEVTEFQGFYGPFIVPAKLLQKIWLRGDFDGARARTLSGEEVTVSFPGKWNLLGGPDFRGARLRIGGREVEGDVELHFRMAEWFAHGHHLDPVYERVVLHVLLFRPPEGARPATTRAGVPIPAMALLDLLHHDLEEYAAEEALETTMERSHWQTTERLLALPLWERRKLLVEHAERRWRQKVHFAEVRLKRLGWEEACHSSALEILGYRRNRGPMLNVASRFPVEAWRAGELSTECLLAAGGRWHIQGSRPANHPNERLAQYASWMAERPDWTERWRKMEGGGGAVPAEDGAVGLWRRRTGLRAMRTGWVDALNAGAVGGTRFDTLMCDGLLPLATAADGVDRFGVWFAWYPGDFPKRVVQTLRTAEIVDRRDHVSCNGYGQGVLSLSMQQRGDPLACID